MVRRNGTPPGASAESRPEQFREADERGVFLLGITAFNVVGANLAAPDGLMASIPAGE